MIQPLSNRVLIEAIIPSEYTDSGLYVPRPTTTFVADAWKRETITRGKVLAVGPGKAAIPMTAKIGQIVTFSDTCSREFSVGEDKVMFIRDDDIVCTEEPA